MLGVPNNNKFYCKDTFWDWIFILTGRGWLDALKEKSKGEDGKLVIEGDFKVLHFVVVKV